jgi:hypothetical protein
MWLLSNCLKSDVLKACTWSEDNDNDDNAQQQQQQQQQQQRRRRQQRRRANNVAEVRMSRNSQLNFQLQGWFSVLREHPHIARCCR